MLIRARLLEGRGRALLLFGSLSLSVASGCGDDKSAKKPTTVAAKADGGKAGAGADTKTDTPPPADKVDESGAGDGAAAAAEAGAAAAEAGAAEAGGGEAGAAEAGAAEAGAAEVGAAEAGAAEAGDEPPAADAKALLKEAKRKKTKDARALEALAEAEAAGAELRDVAKAAYDRGNVLFSTPARAKKFYEWSKDKDPKYPEPVFALAKQRAIAGEIEATKKLLVEVKKRKGKKLLSQIEFDATWEIVKDDPDVRALLK